MAGAGAGAVGLIYPLLMAHTGDRGIPCPLRTLTGVPCPCCGMTTATVSLVHGGWLAAARTNPVAYLLAALVIGTAPVLVARLASSLARSAALVRRREAPYRPGDGRPGRS